MLFRPFFFPQRFSGNSAARPQSGHHEVIC
jgi:hypothetical protein